MTIAVISLVIEAIGDDGVAVLVDDHFAGRGVLHHHRRRAQVDDLDLLGLGLGKTDGQSEDEKQRECSDDSFEGMEFSLLRCHGRVSFLSGSGIRLLWPCPTWRMELSQSRRRKTGKSSKIM